MKVIERETLIGKRIPKMDAPEKASGKTRYIHDIDVPGQLWGRILRSSRVHARIKRIDVSRAKALPGVHVVITAADIPGGAGKKIGAFVQDRPPLAAQVVRHMGEPVAVVVAETPDQARGAAAAVQVTYAPLPAVLDPLAALLPEAPPLHPGGGDHRHDDGERERG